MALRSTHIYKTVGTLDLVVDIYTRASDEFKSIKPNNPAVLWFHGGGLVDYDRRLLPGYVVQFCLLRGWPLVSADYRLLPQASGREIVGDAEDSYAFVREKLFGILTGEDKLMENIIVMGASGGGILAMTAGHYLTPKPLALFIYYAGPTFQTKFFRSGVALCSPMFPKDNPLSQDRIQHFLDGPVTSGFTHPHDACHQDMLLPDLTPNPDWQRPGDDRSGIPRVALFPWFLQTNQYPELMKEVDHGVEHPGWKDYPVTIFVHGDKDIDAPYEEGSVAATKIIGPTPARLFTVPGEAHAWDTRLWLGDPGLKIVEEAWAALDEIVASNTKSGE